MNIEFDLKEILTRLETKVDKISEDASDIKTNLVRVEAELKGEIWVLDEKIDGIVKWVDTQEFINRGVVIGLVLAILGGFAKIFGFVS
ncbi:MAG: hypothetical protein CLLPBCKN_005857 [Chroococcidiopsis cubana SAG 39.79]|uniref:Uncharacterized protein n=2 Tax=Chroococcidiopsis TaxID=54298 RepID=K9U7T9_CHRTP|nr:MULTISPECIES: hypothetical protein [Chroococcidiopsis]AFY90274.1 hypothetical protein Chro_4895 [Chroococcidiopsis thermalis PCC 7203]MDZ4876437.1 hypothetical protein [Chroococcidiopsis cubana SAG 39.79]RUT12710.1 hypothetical protein DSM107010_20910 [Chroococcidiopsis cubana SAG 39.79]URD49671.1 hemolysin XhlA family protein [Chroococcidiopsis sp. CCNUC1]